MIWIIVIILLLLNVFSWMAGLSFGIRFRSSINLINYFRGKDEWPTRTIGGIDGESVYAKNRAEAMLISRKHNLRIADISDIIEPNIE